MCTPVIEPAYNYPIDSDELLTNEDLKMTNSNIATEIIFAKVESMLDFGKFDLVRIEVSKGEHASFENAAKAAVEANGLTVVDVWMSGTTDETRPDMFYRVLTNRYKVLPACIEQDEGFATFSGVKL